MRVDVLGPLRLVVGGEVVDVPGPRRRALLALLAAAGGRVVPVEQLLDALWPAGLPATARSTLHSHVSRLRGHLGPAACLLVVDGGGYALRLGPPGGTDVDRVRALLAAATEAPAADARRLLGEARAYWRGEPLAEFADVAPLHAEHTALDALRRAVDEAYAEALLATGAAGDAAEVAAALCADDPLAEPPVRLHMRALHAAGRPADALRIAYGLRRRLAGEAGLDPSPTLGALEREIAGGVAGRPAGLRRPAPLHGREAELAELRRLLAGGRLVTLLGPGGVGKTRLAAEAVVGEAPVTMLLLAPVTSAAAIPDALAAALDLRVAHGDVLPACGALLGGGPHLLVVDNCEHLLAGVRDAVAVLLGTCPELTVLATSREPLGLPEEHRMRVGPLAVDGAAALFLDRARRVRPAFAPGAGELRLVTEIVRRLDGMPLAIELAAGRLSSLELEDVHSRLDRALDLLADGTGRSLRRAIAWSYELLPDPERRLFRHLCAFPDGVDLATAEVVGTQIGLTGDIAGTVAHLVDASMLRAVAGRYGMLETVRAFAGDRLDAEGERAGATEAFLGWALDLATWADAAADEDEAGVDRVVRREIANLRAAWRLLRELGRMQDAVRLLTGLDTAAGWRDLTEVGAWSLELVAGDPSLADRPEAAGVLGMAAGGAWARGELDRAERLARDGLRAGGQDAWRCEGALALVALGRGDLDAAVGYGTRAAARAPRPDHSLGVAALAAAYDGDLAAAGAYRDRLAEGATSVSLTAFAHYVGGEIAALAGHPDRAEACYEDAITLARSVGATFVDGIASVGLLTLRADRGRVAEALDGYRDLIDYWERTGGWNQQWTTLRNLARLLGRLGDARTAALLDAAADRAPDAAPAGVDRPTHGLGPGELEGITATAAQIGRGDVLAAARAAIDRHRAARDR